MSAAAVGVLVLLTLTWVGLAALVGLTIGAAIRQADEEAGTDEGRRRFDEDAP